jgi:hypothetical protein
MESRADFRRTPDRGYSDAPPFHGKKLKLPRGI